MLCDLSLFIYQHYLSHLVQVTLVRAQMQTNKSGSERLTGRQQVHSQVQDSRTKQRKLTGRLGVHSMNSGNKQTTTIWRNRLDKVGRNKWEQVWAGEVTGTGEKVQRHLLAAGGNFRH